MRVLMARTSVSSASTRPANLAICQPLKSAPVRGERRRDRRHDPPVLPFAGHGSRSWKRPRPLAAGQPGAAPGAVLQVLEPDERAQDAGDAEGLRRAVGGVRALVRGADARAESLAIMHLWNA